MMDDKKLKGFPVIYTPAYPEWKFGDDSPGRDVLAGELETHWLKVMRTRYDAIPITAYGAELNGVDLAKIGGDFNALLASSFRGEGEGEAATIEAGGEWQAELSLDDMAGIFDDLLKSRPAAQPELEGVEEIRVSPYAPDEDEEGDLVGYVVDLGQMPAKHMPLQPWMGDELPARFLLISKRVLDEYWQDIKALDLPVYLPGRVLVDWSDYEAEDGC